MDNSLNIHRLVGKVTGLPRKIATERTPMADAERAANMIINKFKAADVAGSFIDLGRFRRNHKPTDVGKFSKLGMDKKHCKIEYEIQRP